jgi:hypothetical protein
LAADGAMTMKLNYNQKTATNRHAFPQSANVVMFKYIEFVVRDTAVRGSCTIATSSAQVRDERD